MFASRASLLASLCLVVCACVSLSSAQFNGHNNQFAVGRVTPLRNGGVLVETIELSLFPNKLFNTALVPDNTNDAWHKTPEWPQDLAVSFCDSLAKPRDRTSCLTELIRRMEDDINRKMELLVDTDVSAQVQIAALWIVLLLLTVLASCGMCLKMIRRRDKRASYKRLQRQLMELEEKARAHDLSPDCHHDSASYAAAVAPQVMFQPIQVLPQYYPIPVASE